MIFESFSSAWSTFLIIGFLIALVMGAVVNKTGFCTMGGVSDWVNMGDKSRFRAWMFAIGLALIGVVVLEYLGVVKANSAFPPYRGGTLMWLDNILGGFIFGIGMTLASGCGNKNLVRFGAGNFKSLIVLAIIAVVAYFMVNPFPGSDKTLYSLLVYPWSSMTFVNTGVSQDLGTLIAGSERALNARLVIGLILGLALIGWALKSAGFRKDVDHWLAGIVVGLAILGAWVVTSQILIDADGETLSLSSYYTDWELYADDETGKPAAGAPLSPQSYTFINPMGQTLGYAAVGKFASNFLTFGIVAALGVILGSLLWALFTKGYRLEWFSSFTDFKNHFIGAIMMGFGGVLGMGCTLGQGIAGVSTLALGSFLTLVAIVFGSALTMKTQYYKLVYEEEASFGRALRAALRDLRLAPDGENVLEKV